MNLAEHQRKLLKLIKGNYHPLAEDEPYLQVVAISKNLGLVREISTWWRIFDIERYCALTTRLLKQRGEYETSVNRFVRTHAISPFINELGDAFLQDLTGSEDRLLSEVSRFELALTRVKRGDNSSYVIEWEHDPVTVLACLVKGILFDANKAPGRYLVTVSAGLPGMFSIDPIGEAAVQKG